MDTLNIQASRPRHISPEEWAVRVDLAACYRLVAHFGWDDLILTHNSARVPGEPDHMLINPSGLMFDEVTASNILKVDFDGNLVEPSEYEPIYAGVVIHGAIYLGRPDVECVIHTHTEADIAVGVLEEGLLPLSQWAMRFYNRLGYHDYEGVSLDMDEREPAAADHRQPPGAGAAQPRAAGDRAQRRRGVLADLPFRALGRGAAQDPGGLRCRCQDGLPARGDLRETGGAIRHAGNTPRLGGQREWPALLRLCDRLDPAFRT